MLGVPRLRSRGYTHRANPIAPKRIKVFFHDEGKRRFRRQEPSANTGPNNLIIAGLANNRQENPKRKIEEREKPRKQGKSIDIKSTRIGLRKTSLRRPSKRTIHEVYHPLPSTPFPLKTFLLCPIICVNSTQLPGTYTAKIPQKASDSHFSATKLAFQINVHSLTMPNG